MTEDGNSKSGQAPHQPGIYVEDAKLIDLEPLLAPISPDQPCGVSLKYEDAYDRIREARREEDADLPAGVWERRLKTADWQEVIRISTDVLTNRTKDLQIAAWLTEALTHLHRFEGLKTGLHLMLGLCRRYWDGIYPELLEGDLDNRLFPFHWLNEKFPLTIKRLPITADPQEPERSHTFAEWERGGMIKELGAKTGVIARSGATPETAVTRAKILKSVRATSIRFYARLYSDVSESIDYIEKITKFLDESCGAEAPSLSRLVDVLNQIQKLADGFLNEKKDTDPSGEEEITAEGHGRDAGDRQEGESGRPFLSIRNRDEAYRMLSEAADYLHIHEPHSPTPYLVKRAVSWGHMTLEELLKELVGDKGNLNQIFRLLGIDKMDS